MTSAAQPILTQGTCPMNRTIPRPRRTGGFTIIELLIAVIIIGILVAIIVPVLANRASDARLAAVRTDLESLKTAEEHAAIDTGYFYRLYVLDDVRGGDGIGSNNANDVTDGVRDEALHVDAGNPTRLFIDTVAGTLLNNPALYTRLTGSVSSETSFNWNGSYVNYAKKTGPVPRIDLSALGWPSGLPIDPYGNPYLFFTKVGLMNENSTWGAAGEVIISATITPGTFNCLRFDRPTILSLGPDGVPGSTATPDFGQGDDTFRQF